MPGHTEHFDLTVGEHVSAVLTGDEAFKIEPRSEQTQRVRLAKPYPSTLWQWQVTALHGGDHVMTIATAVQAKDRNGRYHELSGAPQSYAFKVKVGPVGRAQDALELAPVWLKLLAGVFVALTALLVAIKKTREAFLDLLGIKRKPEKPEKPDTPGSDAAGKPD